MKAKFQGVRKMFNSKEIGKQLSVAICAVLFGSTMVLSAVGPAKASEPTTLADSHVPATVRYLA